MSANGTRRAIRVESIFYTLTRGVQECLRLITLTTAQWQKSFLYLQIASACNIPLQIHPTLDLCALGDDDGPPG